MIPSGESINYLVAEVIVGSLQPLDLRCRSADKFSRGMIVEEGTLHLASNVQQDRLTSRVLDALDVVRLATRAHLTTAEICTAGEADERRGSAGPHARARTG